MDLRDYGGVPIFDTKEEEIQWREDQERKLLEEEKKAGRRLTNYVEHNKHPISTNVGKPPKGIGELIIERRPTKWIVDSFGAEGACVSLAGESGSGKTSLMYAMAYAISKGHKFLDQLATVKRKVLFIQSDESRNNALDKIFTMGISDGIDFVFGEDGWDSLDVPRLEDEIKRGHYGAIFLDSVTTLLMSRGVSMKDPEYSTPIYQLNDLASRRNILIVISSHLNKNQQGERVRVTKNCVMGTATQVGACSDIWGLWKERNPQFSDHFVLGCLGKRNCDEGQMWNLQGSQEDYSWLLRSCGENDLLPGQKNELRWAIVSELETTDEALTAEDLSKRLGKTYEHTRRTCRRLHQEGEITRKQKHQSNGRPLNIYQKLNK